jgi:hypothetical protein
VEVAEVVREAVRVTVVAMVTAGTVTVKTAVFPPAATVTEAGVA